MSSSTPVVRQLRLVFIASTILLLISLGASYYSIQQLIENSQRINHTNQVLTQADNILASLKDAETGQRGYLVTRNQLFLQPYNGAYEKTAASYDQITNLTIDNPDQRQNMSELKQLYEAKFQQMQRIVRLFQAGSTLPLETLDQEMQRGKLIMDKVRIVVDRVKRQENALLAEQISRQQVYISYTPLLLLITGLLSIIITAFAYVRIKRELDDRMAKQLRDEADYAETNRRITVMERMTHLIAAGDYTSRNPDSADDDLGRIARSMNNMTDSLERTFTDLNQLNWLRTGRAAIGDALRGQRNLSRLGNQLLTTVSEYVGAPLATLYLNQQGSYELLAHYATQQAPLTLTVGEGIVGQALQQQKAIVIDDLPTSYLRISSSLGESVPGALLVTPLLLGETTIGVIELGFFQKPDAQVVELLESSREAIAIGLNAALSYNRLQQLFNESQAQATELQAQQHELEKLNAELEIQTQKLQASEEELRVQQEELQQTNAELEERGVLLEERNNDIRKKADELELTTRYKSEFLANMSHELRTPLNSILLLSRLLAENSDQNLNDDQVEYAQVIQSSGNGLLGLIDEILDLSKIEAGQMSLEYLTVSVQEITAELQNLFGLLAREKGLSFVVNVDHDVPLTFETDRVRLGQILKNLISNALKFTQQGSVTLAVSRAATPAGSLCFSVKDTGIGIAPDKQALVFEAFQQADGSTKRKFGGTGLGLSISRELARLLGGEITLTSELGQGSVFTLCVPTSLRQESGEGNYAAPTPAELPVVHQPSIPAPAPARSVDPLISAVIPNDIPDDRDTIESTDKVMLIVEDDPYFARSLLDYTRQKGYKGVVAVRGDEGVRLATHYQPAGILLDVQLPVMSGWDVMDALKANPQTRPIPVHVMSSMKVKKESLLKGAIDFVDKPVAFDQLDDVFSKIEYVLSRDARKVLIIEDNPKHAKALAYYLSTFNINSELKSDLSAGLDALKTEAIDCVILDMGIPDSKAYTLLDEARKDPTLEKLPIIIFTGKSLSMAEEMRIRKYADSIIVKTAHSYQRMLDEVSLFLHLVEEQKAGAANQLTGRRLNELSQVLTGRTVLVADDDVRNIFSLTKALEQYNMTIIPALDGKEALQKLQENPAVDVVLLDMMMPQMDGYETATRIRENALWRKLPVIAVTAKAMTGDRDRCIQAGASDYITKPVDIDQLVSLLRVWLYDRS
ncbi:response regulator [Spirosoma rhododendri]|uniref:histidine kinase n=1 Tax=Spirosoma rhododendri TaxID=2728024 RepID=A0A7L5DR43_9BACT|nr:response regulator [Spirosoma rhododendri]QJD80605.1 response regulator [Spirosoma rhododendri]